MIPACLKDKFSLKLKNIPLRVVLIVPFVLLTTLAVGLTGYLSFRNGRQAVNGVTVQLHNEIAVQIERELETFLDTAQLINLINANVIQQGLINPDDPATLERYFWQQIQLFETVTSIYFGNPQGGLANAGREGANGFLYLIATDGFAAGPFRKYATDEQGNRTDLLATVPNFDARIRPWYTRAVESGQPAWSDIYILATGQDMALATSRPVYDSSGELLGVVSNDIFLSHLSNFLQNLTAGKTGEIFIIEHSGLLVASSTGEYLVTIAENNRPRRLSVAESNIPLVKEGFNQLVKQFGNLESLKRGQDFEFELEDRRYLAYVTPFQREPNPDWLVVILSPEADFIVPIQANTRNVIWLIMAALAVAIVAGIITAHRVSQPLLNLNKATKRLAAGEWTQPLRFDYIKEINELSQSFNMMAIQLTRTLERMTVEIAERKQAEEQIIASERRFRALIEKSADAIVLLDAAGNVVYESPSGLYISGYSAEERIGRNGLDLIHPDDLDEAKRLFAGLIRKPEANVSIQLRSRRKDGAWRWLDVTAANLLADPAVQAVVVNYRDITERKQAEESLRQSEASLRNIFETAAEGICSINESNTITLANPQFAQMVGYSVNELIGKNIELLISQEDMPDFKSRVKDRQAGKRDVFERLLRRKNSSIILTRVAASPILDESGAYKGSFGLFTDITESRRVEEQLRLQVAALEAAANAIVITDINGLIEWVNPAFTALTGYEAAEAVGRNPRDLIKSDRHDESFYKEMWSTILAGRVWRGQVTNRRKDGSLYIEEQTITPVPNVQDQITHFIAIKQDITEHKRAEQQLRENEARNRALLQAIPDLIFVQSRDGVYLDYHAPNPNGLFAPTEEFLGKRMQDVLPEFLTTPIAAIFEQTLDTGQTQTYEYELSIAGQPRYFEARIAPYGDDKFLSIIRDITGRKQLEARLLQAQKMEAVGRLAGGIAHDFNNILLPIIGYAELGMLKLPPDDELYADLERIRKAADRAAGLVHQILAFSRRQMLKMRALDLNTVITDFSEMIRRLIGEDIELQTFLQPSLYQVKADKGQLEQVLLNLALNSRDAMPEGGKLTIETTNAYLDEAYVKKYMEMQSPGYYAMLSVSDTGHGIDAATKEHIFEPFFTTKEESKGTGLGLATVFGIIKQHGGNIWVYSEPGNGATFKIYLPQAKDVAQAPVTDTTEEVVFMGGTETILVVEDEEMVRRLVCETLAAHGYKVIEAQGPTEARQLATEYEETIHLLLTDVIMPDMNGIMLYQKMAAIYPNIRVLYMSGYTDNAIVHHGVLDEGVNFLQKPFTVNHLTQKVREVFR